MWQPVDTQFFGPKTPVAIACVHDPENAQLFRHLLEGLWAVTHYHNIGCPTDFLHVIGQEETAPPYLVIAGHGGDHGIHFGEYGVSVDTSSLEGEDLPAASVAKHVKLPNTVILNITCDCGSEEMARAFLSGGARAYIGTDPNPLAIEHPLFVAHFFHSIIRKKMEPFEAWQSAAAYDSQSRLYMYYDADGRNRLDEEFQLVRETFRDGSAL